MCICWSICHKQVHLKLAWHLCSIQLPPLVNWHLTLSWHWFELISTIGLNWITKKFCGSQVMVVTIWYFDWADVLLSTIPQWELSTPYWWLEREACVLPSQLDRSLVMVIMLCDLTQWWISLWSGWSLDACQFRGKGTVPGLDYGFVIVEFRKEIYLDISGTGWYNYNMWHFNKNYDRWACKKIKLMCLLWIFLTARERENLQLFSPENFLAFLL